MRVFKYGKLFELIFPNRIWSKNTADKVIYLTFDDGPIPEVTPYVLSQLDKVNAKATFFVVGDNVKKHPEVYKAVIKGGHKVGNHTMNHLNDSKCNEIDYLNNIKLCEEHIQKENRSKLFRPPYGKLSRKQERKLVDYKIVMWSILGYDFDPELTAEKCLNKITKLTKPGSIVVLHDSVKTIDKLKYVLPKYLETFTQLGYQFKTL